MRVLSFAEPGVGCTDPQNVVTTPKPRLFGEIPVLQKCADQKRHLLQFMTPVWGTPNICVVLHISATGKQTICLETLQWMDEISLHQIETMQNPSLAGIYAGESSETWVSEGGAKHAFRKHPQ